VVLAVVQEPANGGMDGTAEVVTRHALAKGFTMYAILLGAKSVGDIVSHEEGWLGKLLPRQDLVVVQELDVTECEWGCAVGLGQHVFTRAKEEEEGNAGHVSHSNGSGCG